jgi:hypothetical protein
MFWCPLQSEAGKFLCKAIYSKKMRQNAAAPLNQLGGKTSFLKFNIAGAKRIAGLSTHLILE